MSVTDFVVWLAALSAFSLIVIPPLFSLWHRLMHIKPFNLVVNKYYDYVDYWVEKTL